jgi:hypothetical protein
MSGNRISFSKAARQVYRAIDALDQSIELDPTLLVLRRSPLPRSPGRW